MTPPFRAEPKEVSPEGECEYRGVVIYSAVFRVNACSSGLYPVVRLVTGSLPGHEVYHGIGPHVQHVSVDVLAQEIKQCQHFVSRILPNSFEMVSSSILVRVYHT